MSVSQVFSSIVSSTYHIWLCSVATDKVSVEKQETEKLAKEKKGSYNTVSSTYHVWLCYIEKQNEIDKLNREKKSKL